MSSFEYVTVATGEDYIRSCTVLSVKSLVYSGVKESCIKVIVNSEQESFYFDGILPSSSLIIADIDMSPVSLFRTRNQGLFFKTRGLRKCVPSPQSGKYLVHFDGDVLWFSNPENFLQQYVEKTWFHHGKGLVKEKR